MKPNYKNYSLDELYDVYDNIDRESYPQRFKEVCEQIKLKEEKEISYKDLTRENEDPILEPEMPVRNVDREGNYIPNIVPLKDRIQHLIIALIFIVIGIYGMFNNGLNISGMQVEGMQFEGDTKWIVYVSLITGCLSSLSIVIDHYDKRDNEMKYYAFNKSINYLGTAIVIGIFVRQLYS